MKFKSMLAIAATGVSLLAVQAKASDLSIVSGATGGDLQFMQDELTQFAKDTGINVKIVPMPSSTTDQFVAVDSTGVRSKADRLKQFSSASSPAPVSTAEQSSTRIYGDLAVTNRLLKNAEGTQGSPNDCSCSAGREVASSGNHYDGRRAIAVDLSHREEL